MTTIAHDHALVGSTLPGFALVGRSFPSESFEGLYQVSLSARRDRRGRGGSWDGIARVWRGSGEAVTLPLRLP